MAAAGLSATRGAATLVQAATLAAFWLAWEALARSGLFFEGVVPSSLKVASALASILGDPALYGAFLVTGIEVAAALAIGGLITLVFTPLPNGDSWMSRLLGGWTNFAGSGGKDFSLILGQDSAGNNAITIFGLQIVQNVGASIPLFAGAIITKLIGRKFGV